MRRNEKEVTDRSLIDSYIREAKVCRVGLVDGDEAYIVPMNFGYADGCFYFHCAHEGRKIDLVRRVGKASFELDLDRGLVIDTDAYKCTNHFICVMGTGTIEIVSDAEERTKGLRALMGQYSHAHYEFSDKCLGKTSVLRLKVETISCKKNGV
ncbi:MAG TPA: pyridoxamine 5'-phosphate oxidase family protein [Methanomassiliicoccales archaeon]|nr:pyridoxamine 5'-phosphate oxidase family protein [Methanomassiliicoccales archaeon]